MIRPVDPGTREVAVDVVAADHVEHDVDPLAPGEPCDRVDEVLPGVVDDQVGAQRPQASTLPVEAVTTMRAPMARAIWMAAVPTPDAPAWTSAARPGVEPALDDEGVLGGEEHLGHGGGVGQAQLRRAPAGPGARGRTSRSA